jgi:nuclear pore complex protein Nup54
LEQIALIYKKWNPNDPNCALEGYTYNQVGENAISYAPNADEDPAKWEEALAKKPYEDAVPVLLRGFKALNLRIEMQNGACRMLAAKLNQLNDALVDLMQDHDLKFQVRCNEARNKHKQYTQRVIKLAAKVQILRNRGYAMDSTEEELKKKLMELEKKAFDPILGGRQEEIWARMSAARARAQILQAESEKLGQAAQQEGSVLNEEEQKSLRKVRPTPYPLPTLHPFLPSHVSTHTNPFIAPRRL